jgi:hypothetical protein
VADAPLFSRPDAPHRVHDLLLIAAFAGNDVAGAERDRAQALVEACAECRSLVDDLHALDRATASLPTPPRPRDFRLTAADAARLRERGTRRFVLAAHRPRFPIPQPVAAAITMLGLAGLLVTTIPYAGMGAATPEAAGGAAGGTSLAAPSDAGPLAVQASPGETERDVTANVPAPETAAPTSAPPSVAVEDAGPGTDDPARTIATVGSAVLAVGGAAAWVVARRRRLPDA